LVAAVLVNAGGLFIAILEPDGALYATIAKTIAQTGDFLNLRVDGKDWLDKPHFPFWMAALSFRLFGINSFAYKLPALLFWGLGAWYTYRFALAVYGRPVARLAALIYVSAAHLVISNNDVRAEPYLTGLIIGSVYHFYKTSRLSGREGVSPSTIGLASRLHLVAGSLLAGCAVMTKGPFVLITISGGFITDWILTKDWRQFRNPCWWIALALTTLFITPELYCLYIQFDLHPEKLVFGRTGVSGIRFFFWDSQFGRFFNTGPIRGSGDPFFYLHTLLWAFLPWSLLCYAAIIQKCRNWKKGRAVPGNGISAGAAILSLLVFSLSRFQLPHYLNILFPFFSVITAAWLYGLYQRNGQKIVAGVQNGLALLLPLLAIFLCWLFHSGSWPFTLGVLLVFSATPFLLFRGGELPSAIARSYWVALLTYGFINFWLYPGILRYQAGTEAGRYVSGLPEEAYRNNRDYGGAQPSGEHRLMSPPTVYMLQEGPVNYSFEFYCRAPIQRIPGDSLSSVVRSGKALFFLPSASLAILSQKGYKWQELKGFPNFHISQLTGSFLDYRTRPAVLEWYSVALVFK